MGEPIRRSLELKVDGVYLSPDGMGMDSGQDWEIKSTWRSLGKWPPQDMWHWQTQFKAYCYAMNTNTTNLVALYICGDYLVTKEGRLANPKPRLLRARFTYTKLELEQNWQMIMNAREDIVRRGLTDQYTYRRPQ